MNLTRAYRDRYDALGWSVIPIPAGTKATKVSWATYQSRRATDLEWDQWSQTWPKAGLAAITGAVSGIVVLDVDFDESRAPAASDGPSYAATMDLLRGLPHTATVKTSKGRHYYFRHPGTSCPNRVAFLPGLDFRGDGGYALLPPSVHPSGIVYAWENPPEDGIADLPAELIQAMSLRDDTPLPAVVPSSQPAGGGWQSLLEGVSEGGRNAAAAKVIGGLLGTTDRATWHLLWPAIRDWNQLNRPPLNEGELKTTFNSILKRESARARNNEQTPDFKSVLELDAVRDDLPAPVWAVQNMIMGVTLLVAKPKVGKSALALQAGLAVARGRPVFPQRLQVEGQELSWNSQQGAVLYLDLEDSERRLIDRIRTMTGGNPPPKDLHYVINSPHKNGTQWLHEQIERYNARLTIIDMLPTFLGASFDGKQAYQAEYHAIRGLTELSRSTGCSILVLQHARKSPPVKGLALDPFDSISGTLGYAGAADTILMMEEYDPGTIRQYGDKHAKFHVKGRDVVAYDLALHGDKLTKTWQVTT